jgi:cysteine-rich repeat protein
LCRKESVFQIAICGNGKKEGIEECDDGNVKSGDGCDNLCRREVIPGIAICGNSKKEKGEDCDNGNLNGKPGNKCDASCKWAGEELKPSAEEPIEGVVREIRIIAHPEKRVNASQNWATLSKVVFYSKTLGKTMLTVSVDLNNVGWATFSTDKLDEGVYDISLKGRSHLTKVLRRIAIDQTTETIDFSESFKSYLVAGDVHESKDDFVNGLDISATVNALYSDDIHADLNRDGLVNALDLSIVVGNIYKYGEKIKI